VYFLPAGKPPHKRGVQISRLDHRLRMVEQAIAGNARFGVSRADLERPGASYTVDLLAALREELGPDPELYFIVGMDSLLDLKTWKEPERLLEECFLVVVSRPGKPPPGPDWLEEQLPRLEPSRLLLLDTPGVDISSTELRARVKAGRSLRYLTPDPVIELIEAHRLYR
jgi:nicotinate-nucleotide adenylyltransferase